MASLRRDQAPYFCSKFGLDKGVHFRVFERTYDPTSSVVCINEMNRQLIEGTRIPCKPGHPEKVDSEYARKGVLDVFMISEPLAGKRDTVVTQTRTAVDFAHILQHTANDLYPDAEKIVLVTDNLNTHTSIVI